MNQYASFESMTQTQLMNCINEVSFALDDLLLYLDTHPYDCQALQYADQFTRQRNAAVAVYSRRFEPLTIDSMEVSQDSSWNWILQPWPWEITGKGGCCSCGTMKRDCNTR